MEKLKVFRIQQGVLALCHLGIALALIIDVAIQGQNYDVGVELTFNRWGNVLGDACTEGDPCVIYNFIADIFSINLSYVVPSFSLISGTHHLIAWYSLGSGEESFYLRSALISSNWLRYLDWASSSSLMIIVNSILWQSPPEFMVIFLWVALQATTNFIGFLCESAWLQSAVLSFKNGQRALKWAFWSASLLYFGAWGCQIVVINGNFGHLDYPTTPEPCPGVIFDQPPIFVQIFAYFLVLSFAFFPIIVGWKISAFPWQREPSSDIDELLLRNLELENLAGTASFFAKLPLLATYAGGVLMQGSDLVTSNLAGTCPNTTAVTTLESETETASRNGPTWGLFGAAIGLSIIFGSGFFYLFKKGTVDKKDLRRTYNAGAGCNLGGSESTNLLK